MQDGRLMTERIGRCHIAVSRRAFLAELGGLAAASVLHSSGASAQVTSSTPNLPFRIDTHHHYTVPSLRTELIKANQQPMLDWTLQKSLEDMDRGGVATAILSVGEPGLWFGDDAAARRLARECNESGAQIVRDHPGRFGLFAALPLPDVDGALREVEYALDVLHADGICVLSSYQGHYLGNVIFAPLMNELNRRKTLVYCHPSCAACASGGAYRTDLAESQNRSVEFVFDTTRTIVSLLASGTVTRCPEIRFIWSHGGGTVPFITGRLGNAAPRLPNGVISELQKFYYDTALAFSPYTLASFKKLIPSTQILFGTDFPFGSGSPVANGLAADGGFTAAELRAIERGNALQLMPRLKM